MQSDYRRWASGIWTTALLVCACVAIVMSDAVSYRLDSLTGCVPVNIFWSRKRA